MTAIIIFFILHWYLSLFTQTFFNHRYAAHGMFTMNKGWERFFFVLTYIFQGSSYLSPYVYGVLHRMHHTYADTENDPHSPKFSDNLFDMMWKTKIIYSDLVKNKRIVEDRFLKDVPRWKFIDWLGSRWSSRLGFGIAYTAFYIYFVPEGMWYLYLLLPIHYFMGPFHGAIINWFAHKFGYQNFEVKDTSRNFLPFDFLMLGESYHNNHHRFGNRANFGYKWFEIDPVYIFIKLFDKLGIIKLQPVGVKVEKKPWD